MNARAYLVGYLLLKESINLDDRSYSFIHGVILTCIETMHTQHNYEEFLWRPK